MEEKVFIDKECPSCEKIFKVEVYNHLLPLMKKTLVACDDCFDQIEADGSKARFEKIKVKAVESVSKQMPQRYKGRIFPISHYQEDIQIEAARWFACWNKNLILYGDNDTGKTCFSFVLAREVAKREGLPMKFVVSTQLLTDLQGAEPRKLVDLLNEYRKFKGVLILDDLGSEKQTLSGIQYYFDLINYRYSNNLYTIYTTNKPLNEICMGEKRIKKRLEDAFLIDMYKNDISRFKALSEEIR